MFLIAVCALSLTKAALVHDGISYSVLLDASAEHPLQVWRGSKKVAESLRMAYHPWSLQIADVDGDDVDEIAVGLTKATRFLPFPHRTLFIMRFDGHQIVRKWAGSSMGRPLLEFSFVPKTKGHPQTLFTLEKRLDGQVALSGHRWTGFGFEKIGREMAWKSAKGLHVGADRLILQANRHTVSLTWRDLL